MDAANSLPTPPQGTRWAPSAGWRLSTGQALFACWLEREELIERHADANDRRALCIRLTHKGKQVAQNVFEQHARWIASLFDNLSAVERKQLGALLEKVSGNLGGNAP